MAWETTIDLAVSLDDAKDSSADRIPEDDYWNACQSQLSTAISLVQQALEFLLKARIIAVMSPYLLISGTPRDWPKGCNSNDTPFAEFYAIDAQYLIRTHDTVTNTRLSEDIKMRFEQTRRLRNSIIHTVDKRLRLEVKQVVVTILEVSNWFGGQITWIRTRRKHIEQSPNSIAYEVPTDQATYRLAREMLKAVDILNPTEAFLFLGFDKKQRRYVCPNCTSDCHDCDYKPRVALLQPKGPTSTKLHCFLCDNDFTVIRKPCTTKGCKGNVFFSEDGENEWCLSCW